MQVIQFSVLKKSIIKVTANDTKCSRKIFLNFKIKNYIWRIITSYYITSYFFFLFKMINVQQHVFYLLTYCGWKSLKRNNIISQRCWGCVGFRCLSTYCQCCCNGSKQSIMTKQKQKSMFWIYKTFSIYLLW